MAASLTIAVVGDICLSDHLLCYGFGVKSAVDKYGDEFIFKNIIPLLDDADIIFGNLECVLSNKGLKDNDIKSRLFRGKPEHISVLKKAGFNILNIANNHTMQYGCEAFIDMERLLLENSIDPLGVKGDDKYNSKPVLYDIKNKKIAMLGYSFEKDRHADGELAYAKGNFETIRQDIAELKNNENPDYIILSCHWGLELMLRPSNHTVKLARQLIDIGVDIILGHHSHTLQGCETYKNKLIIYSLGNFIFDLQWDVNTRKTGIYKIAISDNGQINHNFIPIYINNNYQPTLDGINSDIWDKKQIPDDPDEDIEYANLIYYSEYNKLEKKLYFKKLIFVLKNIWRLKARVIIQLVKQKIKK